MMVPNGTVWGIWVSTGLETTDPSGGFAFADPGIGPESHAPSFALYLTREDYDDGELVEADMAVEVLTSDAARPEQLDLLAAKIQAENHIRRCLRRRGVDRSVDWADIGSLSLDEPHDVGDYGQWCVSVVTTL